MAVVEPDKWYLVVRCRNPTCGRDFAIGYAPAPQEPEVEVELQIVEERTCPYCGSPGRWNAVEVQRHQGSYKH
jgi:hypothetical protein